MHRYIVYKIIPRNRYACTADFKIEIKIKEDKSDIRDKGIGIRDKNCREIDIRIIL